MKLLSKLLAAALLSAGLVAASAAQGYPTRPVQVLIGFPAGGSGDIVARLVMQKLSDLTGNQFVIENRTGAGGAIGAAGGAGIAALTGGSPLAGAAIGGAGGAAVGALTAPRQPRGYYY